MCQQIDMKPDVQIPVPAARLFKWNVAMSVFHTTFAIVVLAAGQIDLKLPVYGSKMQLVVLANETDDDNGWKYVPLQPDRVGWLHATVFTAIFFFCSAFAHFGAAFLWKKQYLAGLASAYAPFRWIEYSVSATVMILILGYIAGTIYLNMLVLLCALTFMTMSFGHLHEVICRPVSLQQWSGPSKLWRLQAHLLGYIPQIFAWSMIISQFLANANMSTTNSFGEHQQMPSFVYGIVFAEMLIFWSFGLVQLVVTLRPPSRYCEGEIMYMWLSLFAKGYLGLMLLSNVLMAGGYSEIFEDDAVVV
jgi:hypothetical protein